MSELSLFAELPHIFASHFEATSAWSLLDSLNDLLGELPSQQIESRLSPEVSLSGDRISIGKGARIAELIVTPDGLPPQATPLLAANDVGKGGGWDRLAGVGRERSVRTGNPAAVG